MKIYTEYSLKDFEFWRGAVDTAEQLTDEDFDTIESVFEDEYPDGMDETDINDIFWFEDDFIAQILGYEDWEDLENSRNDEDDDEDEDEEE